MMALNALKNYERTNLRLTENGVWNVCAMLFWYNLKISKNAYATNASYSKHKTVCVRVCLEIAKRKISI